MIFNYDSVIIIYESLFFCVLYVFSLKYPDVKFSLLGTFQMKMAWFFWVYLYFGGTKDCLVENLIGVAVGALYVFFKESVPLLTGWRPLATPMFWSNNKPLFRKTGTGSFWL